MTEFQTIDLDEWEWDAEFDAALTNTIATALAAVNEWLAEAQTEVKQLKKELADTLSTLSQEATTVTFLMTHSKDSRNDIVTQLNEARDEAKALHAYAQAQIDEANELRAERDAARRVIDAALVQMGKETKAWNG